MNVLIGILKYLEPQKEFYVLCSILIVALVVLVFVAKAYFLIVKAVASYMVKQKECEGRFDLNELKILTLEKGVDKSNENSEKALTAVNEIKICATKMQTTVEEIKNGIIEGKYAKKEA